MYVRLVTFTTAANWTTVQKTHNSQVLQLPQNQYKQ